MGCMKKRSFCRKLAFIILLLFFCNLILITWIVDWQLAIQFITEGHVNRSELVSERLLYHNIKWNDAGERKNSQGSAELSSCNLSGPLITGALSRMRTEKCRAAARDIVCSIDQFIPDSLPNSCPKYDESLRGQYVGCYEDLPKSRVLNGHLYRFKDHNSPSFCVSMCLRAGYSFGGVEYLEECFCGDVLSNAFSLPANFCEQYRCRNENLYCGGFNAIAVYSTGVIEKPLLIVNYSEPNGSSVSKVQILYLLQLNGRNTRQVIRLLRIIYSPNHYYIIHVDSRQPFMFEEMKVLVATIHSAGFSNVYLMERRYPTMWAGATLLPMILDVLKTALYSLNWTTWDFMLNLSESDMPILSMAELEFHLARNKERIFLSTHGYDTARFIQKQGLEYVFMQCEDRMWRLMKRIKFPNSIRLDGGSDWIVISRAFAEYSLSNEDLPRGLRQFFSNVLLPVESFFHTLAANSKYCVQTVKGNLRLTNWKRRQGCHCAMLRKIVDWCGCSPLVFRSSDLSKFSVEVAHSKAVFFGRKFDPLISQQAVATAEAQALRFANTDSIDNTHTSFNRSWISVYTSPFDKSVVLKNLASKLYQTNRNCTFQDLLSITAHMESDEAPIQSIYKSSYLCNGRPEIIQVLVESNKFIKFVNTAVGSYELQTLEIGSDFDFKEEIFRNYHGVLFEGDTIHAKLVWRNIKSLSTSSPNNYTSPEIVAEWRNSKRILIKRTVIQPHDSIYGGQYAELLSNETMPGEWTVEFFNKEYTSHSIIASVKFLILPTNDRSIDKSMLLKYFRRIDVCSEIKFVDFRNCIDTPWSPTFPDLKSRLFL